MTATRANLAVRVCVFALILWPFLLDTAALNRGALAAEEPLVLQGEGFKVLVPPSGKGFSVKDERSGVAWTAGPFRARLRSADGSAGGFQELEGLQPRLRGSGQDDRSILLEGRKVSISISLIESAIVAISFTETEKGAVEEMELLGGMVISSREKGYALVPSREGILIPVDSGPDFTRAFGTSEYEGCHMNVLGLASGPGVAVLSWRDAYTTVELSRATQGDIRTLTVRARGRKTADRIELRPLGEGGLSEIGKGCRTAALDKGLRVTLEQKLSTRPDLEKLIGASNFKLWTCLHRSMTEDSQKEEEPAKVNWTFDEAAQIAEHLKRDLDIDRCLFTIGGWIHRGYDNQHPDVLPAAPECGGNEALLSAIRRIQALGYADSLHDNYQDIYRDSPSWSEALIMKRPDGSLAVGGKWLGGRAYLVCAPKSLELARRPGNLPEVKKLFQPMTYFIDTTFAVGPQECFDPAHPLSRNDDIEWKAKLSDYAREVFGIFGSECGREWAIPHSDFFEGLVGVGGKYYHQLDPASLGGIVVPLFEMVYHDCIVAWGKYGFDPDAADEYVAHHVLCARPLHHHSVPSGLYWKRLEGDPPAKGIFTRADGGWAQGLCRTDRFLKNTHEILGPLHRETAHMVLEQFDFLTPDRSLRRAIYGRGDAEVTVVSNFGPAEATATSALLGELKLPRWGFLIESPRFAAFHATKCGGVSLEGGALFTFGSLDGKPLARSEKVRAFHGFGPASISFRGRKAEVPRETVLDFSGKQASAPREGDPVLEAAPARIEEHRKGPVTVRVLDASGKPVPGAEVTLRQKRHEFLFGCNIFLHGRVGSPADEETYRSRFAAIFNYATLPFYWGAYEPVRGEPGHAYRESVAKWCAQNGIKTKGHPLVWNHPASVPRWLPADPKEVRALSDARVADCVGRFKGLIDIWDVVNESTDPGRFDKDNRMTAAYEALGVVDFTAGSFVVARKANPEATLLINDYRTDDAYEKLISQLNREGRRLYDAIGIQSHMHGGAWSPQHAWNVCEKFARFGVPIHFTETTLVSGPRLGPGENWGPTEPELEEKQAREAVSFYTTLFSHPAVEAITWWDFADRGAWQRAAAGFLRKDLSPKPMYDRLLELIKGTWWTDVTLKTGEKGEAEARAFFGDYEVRVRLGDKEATAALRHQRKAGKSEAEIRLGS